MCLPSIDQQTKATRREQSDADPEEARKMPHHPGYGAPNRNMTSPAGSTICESSTDLRQMRFGLRTPL